MICGAATVDAVPEIANKYNSVYSRATIYLRYLRAARLLEPRLNVIVLFHLSPQKTEDALAARHHPFRSDTKQHLQFGNLILAGRYLRRSVGHEVWVAWLWQGSNQLCMAMQPVCRSLSVQTKPFSPS